MLSLERIINVRNMCVLTICIALFLNVQKCARYDFIVYMSIFTIFNSSLSPRPKERNCSSLFLLL